MVASHTANTYRRSFLALIFEWMVGEPLDLERLCSPEEGCDPLLVHLHLALVHEVEEEAEVLLPHVPQDHDRVLAGVALQHKKHFTTGKLSDNIQ